MKKTICAALAAAVCLTSFSFLLAGRADAAVYRKGDIDNDGKVSVEDHKYLKDTLMGRTESGDMNAADADSDGSITTRDSYYLKKAISEGTKIDEGINWGGFHIAGNTFDGYEIVVSDNDNPNMRFAAEELQKYAKEGDGSSLPIVSEPTQGAHRIVFLSDESGKMGTDGFRIQVEGGNVYITAAPQRGNMYAVYTVLQNYWGYRFYGYNDYELIRDGFTDLPEGTDITEIPTVRYRCNCIDPFKNQYTYQSVVKRRLSGCTDQPSMLDPKYGYGIERLRANAHSFDVFIPFEELGGNVKSRCLSEEKTYEVCLKNMKSLLSERIAAGGVIGNSITEISCSYAADEQYCACRNCRIVYVQEGSYSGVLVNFVNKIDDALHEEYPDITVITNAYSVVRKPPKNAILRDDIVLLYCWNACSNHLIGSDMCQSTGKYGDMGSMVIEKQYFEGWAERCKHIYIWYYPTNIYYLLCPQPNFFKLWENFQWFTSRGVEGFYVVGTTGSSFEDLDAYLICDLMWDTDMTESEYLEKLREYLKYYYGYGWTYIYEYMEMLEDCGSQMGCVLNDADHPFDVYSKEYFAENFDKMQKLFESAMAEADSDRERANIERLSVHMKFLGYSATYDSAYVNGDSAAREEWEDGFRAVYNYINENKIRISYDKVGIVGDFTTDVSPMRLVYGID